MKKRQGSGRAARVLLTAAGLGLAALFGADDAGAQEPDTIAPALAARLSPALLVALEGARADERLPVVVQFSADTPLPAVLRTEDAVPLLRERSESALLALSALVAVGDPDVEVRERLWIVPAVAADATPNGILRLAAVPGIQKIWPDGPLPVVLPPEASLFSAPAWTSQAMRTIGADAVWEGGATGAGATVAIFDSGVDGANAMLSSRWRGRRTDARAAWFDPFRGASAPQDLNGHGTQVAVAAVGGLAAGDTLFLADGGFVVAGSGTDVVAGPAPGAEWIAARVFDALAGGVYTRRSVLLQAFQWALDPDGNPGTDDAPDVINNSWGIAPQTGELDACEDVIYDAVDAVEAAGIAVLFATGNSGPAPGSVAPPSARDDPGLRSFAVGATSGVAPDVATAEYSGRGPSPCGGGIKPEIVAPGTVPEVRALRPTSARLTGFAVQGTSFAVAQASGTIALLRQARPSEAPVNLKQALMDTAIDLGAVGPDNDSGHGLLDVPSALARFGARFSGPLLQLAGASAAGAGITVEVRNRGADTWPGGRIRVAPLQDAQSPPRTEGQAVEGDLPEIAAGASLAVGLPSATLGGATSARVTVMRDDRTPVISRLLLFAPPNVFGGFVLESGNLRAGANDFGRFGRVAALPGFEWRGSELLPAAGFGIAAAGRVSDGFYVTTLSRSDQKDRPAAIDTDWAPQRTLTSVETSSAEMRYDDFTALAPLQLEVRSVLEATESGGVGALSITAWIANRSGSTVSGAIPALFADWDLNGGENVRWSTRLQALVAESRAGGGPLAILAGEGNALARADVPLGLPVSGGFYAENSGILWEEFTDATKLLLMQGGATDGLPGAATATDRAALLAAEALTIPANSEIPVRFWLLAADDEDAAAIRLAELRAVPIQPPDGGGDRFEADPPYPNPLTVGDGSMRFPVRLPADAQGSAAPVTLEVFDIAGRRLYRQRSEVTGGGTPALAWDGMLDGGRPAAAGVYMYVLTFGGERRTGRLILVR
jgi:bacillopeptidase F